jgi:hypothetical protein
MKKSIIVFITLISTMVPSIILKAQNANTTNGVYLTELDYKANKLSYLLGGNDKLQLNGFLNGKNVSLTYQGKKIKLAKSEIYGYRLQNQDFRFYNNESYKIVDTAGFYIYSYDKLIQQGKGPKPTRVYYFSAKTSSGILPLTAENIAVAFPQNHKFKYLAEAELRTDLNIEANDKEPNVSQLKELYTESLK